MMLRSNTNGTIQTVSLCVVVFTLGVPFLIGCKLPSRETQTVESNASTELTADTTDGSVERPDGGSQLTSASASVPAKLASGAMDGTAPSRQSIGTGDLTGTSQASGSAIKLRIRQVAPNTGPVRIAVFTAKDAFPKHKTASIKQETNSNTGTAEIEIAGIPNGQVAVAAYQDINNDGELNRGTFGIPTEPYGFTNDAKGSMGPPAFQDAAIDPRSNGPFEITLTQARF